MAYTFDGTGDYLTCPSGVLNNLADGTCAAWFKHTNVNLANILSTRDTTSGKNWALALNADGIGTNEDWMFAYTNSGSAGTVSKSQLPSAQNDDNWHLVVWTFTWEAASTHVHYYDGTNNTTNFAYTLRQNQSGGDMGTLTYVPYIGARNLDGSPDGPWNGELGEIAVWDTVLTAEEVASLYRSHTLRHQPGNLKWYWPLIGGTKEVIQNAGASVVGDAAQTSDHPPIRMPSAQILQFPPAAAPAGSYKIYENYYRQLMAGSSNV